MTQTAVSKAISKTRRGWVVKEILHSIFTGEFKGGDRLVEEELAVTIGVSRTPVREALGELAGIGVIALKPNHGAIVRPFGPTQIRELYHVRRILESEATRLAADRISPATLRELRDNTQTLLNANPRPNGWATEAIMIDQKFHEAISVSSGSERLAEEIGRYRALVQSIREAVGNSEHAQEVAMVEHTQIIDFLLSRESERAAEAMSHHITSGTEAAVTALFSTSRERAVRGRPEAREASAPREQDVPTTARE